MKILTFVNILMKRYTSLEEMISDFIEMTDFGIKNLSKDDRVKKIVSEAIGVGVGLKYSSQFVES